jgi:hypothetical protein
MLKSRPARNEAVSWETDISGDVVLFVPRADHWRVKLLSKVVYVPKQRKIVLDEIGSGVWEMCDGKTSVAKMIAHVEETYKVSRREAEISLLHYLKTLGEKGLVGFLLEKKRRGR